MLAPHCTNFIVKFHNVIYRSLNKKLRAEELLKVSKLPPSMAKREEEHKKKEALEELEANQNHAEPLTKHNVDFLPQKKKKLRKKTRRTKSAIGPTRAQFARSYVFDSRRDKDKASVKVNSKKFLSRLNLIQELIFSPTQQPQPTPRNIEKHLAKLKIWP